MNKASLAAIAVLVMLTGAAAAADPRQDLVDGMAKCAAMTDNVTRLACYDALNPTLRAAQTAPVPPATAAAPEAQVRPEQFGGEDLAPPAPPPPRPGETAAPPPPVALDSITAEVTDFSFNQNNRFVVFLDNGQIWRQIEGDSDRAHFNKTGKNVVSISRGAMGSYDLRINGLSKPFKVRREK